MKIADAAALVRDGKVLVSDGPLAETKEQIGGYCLIDCKDLEESRGSCNGSERSTD